LLPREHESTIASAESPGNEKKRAYDNPVPEDGFRAFEKKENCHKFISNDTMNMVVDKEYEFN